MTDSTPATAAERPPARSVDPNGKPFVVIEFDNDGDLNEFLAEHLDRRCSDLADWNTYRVDEVVTNA